MLFRDYEPRALAELSAIHDLAVRLRTKFDAGIGTAEQLQDARLLGAAWRSLERALPTGVGSVDLVRHLGFLEYYLERDRPEACRSDIDDICRIDLPKLEQAIRLGA